MARGGLAGEVVYAFPWLSTLNAVALNAVSGK
jgi:hypothetical protein